MNFTENEKKEKPKLQFSKSHVLYANFLVFYVFTANIVLSLLDKELLTDLSMAIAGALLVFTTGGYFTVQAIRDTSLNKHKLRMSVDENGNEYKETIPGAYADNTGEAE